MSEDDPGPVPGLRIGAPVPGRPGSWRAMDVRSGADREVAVLALLVDPDVREAALASLAPLRRPGAGHRQHVVDVIAARHGVAVVSAPLSGVLVGSLRRLDAGQLVTLGLPIARELALLHARGVTFGADRRALAAEIVVSREGRPLLSVAGWARRRVAGQPRVDPAGDRAALVELLGSVARDTAGRGTARWQRVVDAPDCAALARALRRLGRPRPLPLPGEMSVRRGLALRCPSVRASLPGLAATLRAMLIPAAFVTAVALVAAIGWGSARHPTGGGPAQRASVPAPASRHEPVPAATVPDSAGGAQSPDWRTVLEALDRARGSMLAGQRPVGDVDAPAGKAYVDDARLLANLRARGLRARDVLPRVESVRLLTGAGRSSSAVAAGTGNATASTDVVLAVRDTLPPYRFVDAQGNVSAPAGGRGEQQWRVTLRSTAAGWRILDVTAGGDLVTVRDRAPPPRRWLRLAGHRPSSASKSPSSSLSLTLTRKRAASAPSTRRWS